jgi:hypothetical protein
LASVWACTRDYAARAHTALLSFITTTTTIIVIINTKVYASQGCSLLLQSPGGRATRFFEGSHFSYSECCSNTMATTLKTQPRELEKKVLVSTSDFDVYCAAHLRMAHNETAKQGSITISIKADLANFGGELQVLRLIVPPEGIDECALKRNSNDDLPSRLVEDHPARPKKKSEVLPHYTPTPVVAPSKKVSKRCQWPYGSGPSAGAPCPNGWQDVRY